MAASPRPTLIWISLLTVAALLPFINKAWHIDDTLFLLSARQILHQPLDFYGFEVNWSGHDAPMIDEMKNPPLTSYYQTAVAAIAGFKEPLMHLAFIPFAVAAVAGTFLLARKLGAQPEIAAL